MPWLKMDDGFDEHVKIEPLSDKSFRLHVSALCLTSRKMSDGHISVTALKGLLARVGAARRHVEELIEAELWLPVLGGGHTIKDFLEYNRSREQVQKDRKDARDRMKRNRGKGECSGEQTPNVQENIAGSSPSPSFSKGSSRSNAFPAIAETSTAKGRYRLTSHDTPKPIDFGAESVRLMALKDSAPLEASRPEAEIA